MDDWMNGSAGRQAKHLQYQGSKAYARMYAQKVAATALLAHPAHRLPCLSIVS